ncbi:MAG: hypothetical protein KA004_03420 [Verrucomicrobiales bacterium]|nr:hypothetical protein [Verrucomicrobiales bacterium]
MTALRGAIRRLQCEADRSKSRSAASRHCFSHMKKLPLFCLIAAVLPLFQACERQDWKETKMFHDVPKREAGNSGHQPEAGKKLEQH